MSDDERDQNRHDQNSEQHQKEQPALHSDEQGTERGLVPLGSILGGLFPPNMLATLEQETSPQPHQKTTKVARQISTPPLAVTPLAPTPLAIAGAEIAARPDRAELAFQAKELLQCTLPHRDPGEVPVWVRQNGRYALVIQPGFDRKNMCSYGVPFGEIPRLVLIWLVTEAVRTKSRHIKLGNSLNDFLREIGGNPITGGGKRGDAVRMREQVRRLLRCQITFEYREGNDEQGSERFRDMKISAEDNAWWDFKNPEQGGLFESEVILGENFFNAIIANPVPIDLRAVIALKRSLKQSSFAIDIYTWATYRVFRLQRDEQKEVRIPLTSLKEQFGSEYKRLDHFKAAFVEGLGKVKEVWPAFDYALEKNVFVLRDGKTQPAITSRDNKRNTEAARQRLAALQPYHQVSRKKQTWFTKNYPHQSLDEALREFEYWVSQSQIEVGNADALFVTFVKKKWPR